MWKSGHWTIYDCFVFFIDYYKCDSTEEYFNNVKV